MRKNKMMRAASALLVAVLLTTSVISGTFAKYVTTADASDTARVAKFGVTLTVDNDNNFFSDSYTNATNGLTVETSSAGTNLVAPGTSSNENTGTTTITIAGTPEVAVAVSALIDAGTAQDVFLKKNVAYKDWTTEDPDDTFTLDNDYYPVKWTLKQDDVAIVTDGKLSDVITKFQEYTTSKTKSAPNVTIDTKFTLDWAWDFESVNTDNRADTLLGQIVAGKDTSVAAENYSTAIGYTLNVSVTQVD